jgi:excisionase family DNA binding protein
VTSAGADRGLDRAGGVERGSDRRGAARSVVPAGGGGPGRLLSVEELAAYLGVPKKTVYGCWRDWGLRGYRVGRHLRFRQRQVEEWLTSREA